ncbi:uncharacterized protein GIQ15_04828 [Arthroderma uncinatum]|uniref:uncharacterized protein n=1 Tax=Arthroderma uncinatum TaxID=74035 RepID=UPI00144AB4BD|nr:uncharacterized protein GIQ15_04828 [Arthroderma uncinatum]KAF3482069.1 hypothetical protein GIQ15_04828 [Arthroderma uncinatum]
MGFLLPKAGVRRPIVALVFIVIFIMGGQRLFPSIPRRIQQQFYGPPGYSSSQGQPSLVAEDAVILSNFTAGTPKPPGSNYTRTLVVPRLSKEKVDWIDERFSDINQEIYVVDDLHSLPKTPKNKGREAMVYLTYLIDNYDNLPDIILFMHSHKLAWHNEEPLNYDANEMIKRLSNERVMRDGFMNLRCNWAPGCPDWLHPKSTEEDPEKPEQPIVANGWREIFPSQPVPEILGGQCCAQFAISRERVLAVPKSHFVYYRDWLLRTKLDDFYSGRVWEYLWHVIFTGQNVYCPAERACFCDGYGLCFKDDEPYLEFKKLGSVLFGLRQELSNWHKKANAIKKARKERNFAALLELEVPAKGRNTELELEIEQKNVVYGGIREKAFKGGRIPVYVPGLPAGLGKKATGFELTALLRI